MKELVLYESQATISKDLEIDIADVESYFRNYYINRFFPIRDITPEELSLIKYYDELRYAGANEIIAMCAKYGLDYNTYLTDRWLLPKAIIGMKDETYTLLKKYPSLILEPCLNYKNYRSPRLQLLSKEEIAMLLSNIATGTSIIPGDQITVRTSMEAMDRLLDMYDSVGKNRGSDVPPELKQLSPKELIQLIETIKTKGKGQTSTVIITNKSKINKNQNKLKTKKGE